MPTECVAARVSGPGGAVRTVSIPARWRLEAAASPARREVVAQLRATREVVVLVGWRLCLWLQLPIPVLTLELT